MKLLMRLLLNSLVLLLLSHWLPGIAVSGWYAALITALLLGLVNALVRPLLILLTLPITILTLGFFVLVINGILFWFVASFVDGFSVAGFWPAFWGAFIMSLTSWVTGWFLKKD